MAKYWKNITYYMLILLGLILVSWMIWSRFIRERTIRHIPDNSFTEYRFWILLYISIMYLYAIKALIWPKKVNEVVAVLSELFYEPLQALDHFIKYNSIIKNHYYNLMSYLITKLFAVCDGGDDHTAYIKGIYIIQIIPREILVSFLLIDTFYLHKLELLYKIILVGILPFISRYLEYCLKDICNHWIEQLELEYNFVYVYEKGYEMEFMRKRDTLAKYHCEMVSIREYIHIKYINILENKFEDDFPYKYVGTCYSTQEHYNNYRKENNIPQDVELTPEDHKKIDQLFEDLTYKIMLIKLIQFNMSVAKDSAIIKWSKVRIFALYFLSWSFILSISYYFHPAGFSMFHSLCEDIMFYLCVPEDSFATLYGHSLNENCITREKLVSLAKNLLRKLISKFQ